MNVDKPTPSESSSKLDTDIKELEGTNRDVLVGYFTGQFLNKVIEKDCYIALPKRSPSKGVEKITFWIDFTDVKVEEVLKASAEHYKVRIGQDIWNGLTETARAQALRDRFLRINVRSWLDSKGEGKKTVTTGRIKKVYEGMSTEERKVLIAELQEIDTTTHSSETEHSSE